MTVAHSQRLYDPQGRWVAPATLKANLIAIDERMRNHAYDCKACLRVLAGFDAGHRCTTRTSIERQRDIIAKALERAERGEVAKDPTATHIGVVPKASGKGKVG